MASGRSTAWHERPALHRAHERPLGSFVGRTAREGQKLAAGAQCPRRRAREGPVRLKLKAERARPEPVNGRKRNARAGLAPAAARACHPQGQERGCDGLCGLHLEV